MAASTLPPYAEKGWTPPTGPSTPGGNRSSGRTDPPVFSPTPSDATWSGQTLASPLPPNFIFTIWNPWDEIYMQVSYQQLINSGEMPDGLTYANYRDFIPEYEVESTGGSGRGSSGGATGPTYIKPDERLVREAIRSNLALLAGKVNPTFLDELVNVYMSEHKRSFDVRETEQLDPLETVKDEIRATSEYKAIHQLRPESVDEYDWVSSRQGALKRAGVTDIMAERLGIAQATAGASDQDAAYAGNIATFNQSGQQLDELKNRIRTVTYGALQLA